MLRGGPTIRPVGPRGPCDPPLESPAGSNGGVRPRRTAPVGLQGLATIHSTTRSCPTGGATLVRRWHPDVQRSLHDGQLADVVRGEGRLESGRRGIAVPAGGCCTMPALTGHRRHFCRPFSVVCDQLSRGLSRGGAAHSSRASRCPHGPSTCCHLEAMSAARAGSVSRARRNCSKRAEWVAIRLRA